MPDLGKLRWVMDVDTTRFDAKLRGARRMIASVGAGLAAVGAGRMFGAAADRAETIVQAHKATGADVRWLQEMEFAGTQSGMAPGETTAGLIQFSRNLAQLRGGKGPLRRLPGQARGLMGQLLAAPGPEAAAEALAAGVAGMEPGLGGSVLEKAGFAGPGAYELFSQGREGLASERARYYKFGGAPMTLPEAEALKRGSDIVEGGMSSAFGNVAKGIGITAGGVERLVDAIRGNTRATEDNTRSGTRIGP
jgi:hypothetical protein